MLEVFNSLWSLLLVPLTGIVSWFLGGKQAKRQEIKKGDVDIKTAEIDYASKVSDLYEKVLDELKKEKESLKIEKDLSVQEVKDEREYFRKQIGEIRVQCDTIQSTLNQVQLSYAKEVEISQNWEKLHRELNEKYILIESKNTLLEQKYSSIEVEYDSLKKAHEKLKGDFDKYKKEHKIS